MPARGNYLTVKITQTFPNSLVGEAVRPQLMPTDLKPATTDVEPDADPRSYDGPPSPTCPSSSSRTSIRDAVLPIWVGIFEANAIALELEKTATPRPMTHDLLRNFARGLNARVDKVVVSEMRDDTFYAVIWMDQQGETVLIDARPSDAIALALRSDCPIYVAQEVLNPLPESHRRSRQHQRRRTPQVARKPE